jgi:hypothetical protein
LGFRSARDEWREEHGATRTLASVIILDALKRGADQVFIGTPRDNLEKLPRTVDNGLDFDPGLVEAKLRRIEEKKMQNAESLGLLPRPVFLSEPGLSASVWYRISRQWQQVEGVPAKLLPELIQTLEGMFIFDRRDDASRKRSLLRLSLAGPEMLAYVELWYEPDCAYRLKIEWADA